MYLIEDSPDILAIGFDPDLRELHVRYRDDAGATWVYHEVPQEIFLELMDAKSKGLFLHQLVESDYRATKLES